MCDRCVEYGGRVYHVWSRGYYETNIRLHREVWQDANGPIPEGWHVHHKNGDKLDNRLENLELIPISEHSRHHFVERVEPHRDVGIRNSIASNRRNRDRLLDRKLVCVYCGSEFSSQSYIPPRFRSDGCLEKARSGAFMGEDRDCGHCGQRYRAKSRAQKYCSKKCNNRACMRRLKDLEFRDVACGHCGAVFRSKRANAKFCDNECARAHHSNRHRIKVSDLG